MTRQDVCPVFREDNMLQMLVRSCNRGVLGNEVVDMVMIRPFTLVSFSYLRISQVCRRSDLSEPKNTETEC